MTIQQANFIIELETISYGIAAWAAKQLEAGRSIQEVKRKLTQIMNVIEKHS